ncbi:hypothetical protein GUITHDRAFT_103843 [Guillardia theta CCMP2712]|uniref:Uncharacterized protein n=1 Tax=Guillardia theta (strain CCMP2712) TaxID=905079 RepID=L1JPV3_GUITC|nr:hypothetical protein GUITHDRAFT_103843 [Guillardia theta CCMP2712]EKX50621.1 hypothetical protein GUITHDRAFT_103843 [Guillardia theta CCMP2712]|eukprot:XP_005837601.1 hypothetical protein GUITHDRAFT_103843 [Guillardia theta CCMP2712]
MSLTWGVGVNWGIMMPVVVSTTVFLAVFAVCVVTYCWCKLRDQISSYETRQRMPDFRTAFSGAFSRVMMVRTLKVTG